MNRPNLGQDKKEFRLSSRHSSGSTRALSVLISFFFLTSLCAAAVIASLQQKQETLRREVTVSMKLLQVYVVDKKAKFVGDLKKEDFEIFENGRAKQVEHFEKHVLGGIQEQTGLAVTAAAPARTMNRKFLVFIDCAFNSPAGVARAKRTAQRFLETQILPTDEVGFLSYSNYKDFTIHQYFTSDHQKVRDALSRFSLREVLGRSEEPETDYRAIDTNISLSRPSDLVRALLYKRFVKQFVSSVRDLAKALGYVPGVKNIMLFSGGVATYILYGKLPAEPLAINSGDPFLRTLWEEAAKELAAANCPLYIINDLGLAQGHFKDSEALGTHSLHQWASLTGGKYYDNDASYEAISNDIQTITSSYYVLGYYISDQWDGRYQKIEVRVKRKSCDVYGQKGYFHSKPFAEYSKLEKQLHLIDLAFSDKPYFQDYQEFPLLVLAFEEEKTRGLLLLAEWKANLIKEIAQGPCEMVSLLVDEQNNIVKMDSRETSFASATPGRMIYSSVATVPPGAYECCMVLRNLRTGQGARGRVSVKLKEPAAEVFRLLQPLFLIPDKSALWVEQKEDLKKSKSEDQAFLPGEIFSFARGRFAPSFGEIEARLPEIVASVPCAFRNAGQPEISFAARWVNLETREKISSAVAVTNRVQKADRFVFILNIRKPNLPAGKYALYLDAKEKTTGLKSSSESIFLVR